MFVVLVDVSAVVVYRNVFAVLYILRSYGEWSDLDVSFSAEAVFCTAHSYKVTVRGCIDNKLCRNVYRAAAGNQPEPHYRVAFEVDTERCGIRHKAHSALSYKLGEFDLPWLGLIVDKSKARHLLYIGIRFFEAATGRTVIIRRYVSSDAHTADVQIVLGKNNVRTLFCRRDSGKYSARARTYDENVARLCEIGLSVGYAQISVVQSIKLHIKTPPLQAKCRPRKPLWGFCNVRRTASDARHRNSKRRELRKVCGSRQASAICDRFLP